MTAQEFNQKYKDYLEEGFYGLDIHIPSVIDYLDSMFENGLVNITGFKYSQIKVKFGMVRFYFETEQLNTSLERLMANSIEEDLTKLVTDYYNKQ